LIVPVIKQLPEESMESNSIDFKFSDPQQIFR